MRIRARAPLVLAVLAVIYSILPLIFGIFAQRYAKDFLAQENETLGKVAGIQLNLDRYERGWFHSTAMLSIQQKSADGSYALLEKVPLTIFHGPVYEVDTKPSVGFALMTADNIPIDFLPKYHLIFRDSVGFSGMHAFLALLPSVGTDMPSMLDVNRLLVTIDSNLHADRFVFHVNGDGLRYESPDHILSATAQKLDSTLLVSYLSDRHWQLRWGFDLDGDKIALIAPENNSAFTFGADNVQVKGLHVDTEKMANLLSEVVQMKSADEGGAVVPPSAWIGVLQQFLANVVDNDTQVRLHNLSLTSPTGQVLLHYDTSFPTLPNAHDYYDVATRGVSRLMLSIPDWTYADAASNTEFGLSNLKLASSNNTVFSRQMNLEVGAFDVKNMQADIKTPVLYGAGLAYQDHNYGDSQNFSQVMQWRLNQLCFSQECFKGLKGELSLLNLNFAGFRAVSSALRSVVGFNSDAGTTTDVATTKWTDLENAYISLVTPETRVILSHNMQTPEGDMSLYAALSWPQYRAPAGVLPNQSLFLDDTTYQVRAQFPVAYVNAFLAHEEEMQKAMTKGGHDKPAVASSPTVDQQAAAIVKFSVQQGYLKRVDDVYMLDLVGKGANATLNGIPWGQAAQ